MTVFLPRSAWTNHGPIRPLTKMSAGPLKGFAIHWPGNSVPHIDATNQAHIAAEIEGERKYHTRPGGLGVPQGGNDIAYQYAIDLEGRVWELRGVTNQSGANGSSASNRAYGAVTLLLGTSDVPSPAMIQAVRDFRRKIWLTHFPKATQVVGHRDVYSTDCPGPHAYPLVKNGTFVGSAPDPKPKPPPVIPPGRTPTAHILHLLRLRTLGRITPAQTAELNAWITNKPWPPVPIKPPTPIRKPLVTNYVFGLEQDAYVASMLAAGNSNLLQIFRVDQAKQATAGNNHVLVLGGPAVKSLALDTQAPVGSTTTVGNYVCANGASAEETITRGLAAAKALSNG
jgi:hypothetical protein